MITMSELNEIDDMVVVDGIRYRPEEAPKGTDGKKTGAVTSKAARPQNKARSASNKKD